jgi:hypothetical protein
MHFLETLIESEFSRAALCKHKMMNTQKFTIQRKTIDSSITSSCNANCIHTSKTKLCYSTLEFSHFAQGNLLYPFTTD